MFPRKFVAPPKHGGTSTNSCSSAQLPVVIQNMAEVYTAVALQPQNSV